MPSCQELGAQFTVVVDFPVEDNLDRAIFIAERLSTAGQIDNGKTPMNKPNSGPPPIAFAVWTTMGYRVPHSLQMYRIHGPLWIEIHNSCNSTHIKSSTSFAQTFVCGDPIAGSVACIASLRPGGKRELTTLAGTPTAIE